MVTKPVLRWPGGKTRLLKVILPLIKPHVCYCEPFAGGLAVLLAKDRANTEVINDQNRDLVTLYRCVQWHLPALIEEVRWLLPARANIDEYRTNKGLTDLQRAARFVVFNRMSFAGNCSSFGVHRSGGNAGFSTEKLVERLTALRERLDGVMIENVDWERCVRLYDGPNTAFFIDPPYLNADINAYAGWSEAEMTRLRDILRTLKGHWVLTVDGSEFCQDLFKEWNYRRTECACQTVNNACCRKKLCELVITPEAEE